MEFWSAVPYILLSKAFDFLVRDRGPADLTSWVVTTLNHSRFLSTAYGRSLQRPASRESIVYLYADREVLAKRVDVSRSLYTGNTLSILPW